MGKENKLEEILEGICPSCEEDTTFKYLGSEPIEIYNCETCGSTIAYQSILGVNPNLKKSSQ